MRNANLARIVNTLGKVVGIGFTFGGAIMLIYGASQREWLIAVPSFIVVVLGVLLLLARPYRPDLKM